MEFEWDEGKRAEVLKTRGVDFLVAALVFDDPDRLEEADTRRDYGEERRRTLGRAGGNVLMVVYTMRGETRRIITAWKVGRDDQERYSALHDG